MSGYKTHTVFNLFMGLPLGILGLAHIVGWKTPYLLPFSLAFCYGTLFMSPDMDLANSIKRFSLRGVFALPFLSYAWFFKHRGLSHSLIWGTLSRVLWLFLWFLGVFFLLTRSFPQAPSFWLFYSNYQNEILYSFLGIFFADFCHLFLDHLT